MLKVDIMSTAQCEPEHPRTDGVVGNPVDEDEPSSIAVLGIGIEADRLIEFDLADTNVIQLELFCCEVFQRINVDLVFKRGDRCRHRLRTDLHKIRAAT